MNKDLLQAALAETGKNLATTRSGGRSNTYLDRFVGTLIDEDGNALPGKSKTDIIAEISLDICIEKKAKMVEAGEAEGDFGFETQEDKDMFAQVNVKVKNQVNAAVANCNNATSLSYNKKYKDVWAVVKQDGLIGLVAKVAQADAEEVADFEASQEEE